jgi:hypothetical protein
VVHFEILGRDGEKLQKFYTDLFDWKIDASNPMHYGMVEAQAPGIAGGVGPTDLFVGHVTVYVQVDDIEASLRKAEALGGRVMQPAVDVPDGPTVALFSDPEGNVIGLVKPAAR